ncbi:MAG: hypothetical protein JMDDDDMK_00566 [Acidobacteria bacterium]|nr:hypothetical protein [Acidobacteriota bacterium]
MKGQIRNVVTSFLLTAFAGIGLTALAQDPACCPKPVACAQPVCAQPVCTQPVCAQPVCAQPACPQLTTCVSGCPDPCMDNCALVKRIEKSADKFKKYFDRSLKHSCLGCEKDEYMDNVKAFEKATDRLKKDYGKECDTSGQVQEVLRLAECISAYIDPCTLCPEAVAEWSSLRSDLESLAAQNCTTACFQQPISLQPPQPVCVQQTCQTCPAPVVQTSCCH